MRLRGTGENCVMRSITICTAHRILSGDETGGTCGTHEEAAQTGGCWEDLGVDGRIILRIGLKE